MATPFERITWPVRTERLSLRPATSADVEPTWRFRRLEAVSRWLEERPTQDDDEWVESIPYDQTRNYVKRVLRSLQAYRVLY